MLGSKAKAGSKVAVFEPHRLEATLQDISGYNLVNVTIEATSANNGIGIMIIQD